MKQWVFSMLLCVALLFSVFPQVAFAQGDVLDSGLAGKCPGPDGGNLPGLGHKREKAGSNAHPEGDQGDFSDR